MTRGWLGGLLSLGLFCAFVLGLRLYQDIFERDLVEADRAALR